MLNEQVESVMAIAFELARIREEHGAQSGMYLSEVRALRAEVTRLAEQGAAPQAEPTADMVRPSESLRVRCEEALEWNETGYLRDGHLRALARSQPHAEEYQRLKGAESVTSDEAMRFVVAAATQPQQAKEDGK